MLADEWRLRNVTSERLGIGDDTRTIQQEIPTHGASLLLVDEMPTLQRLLAKHMKNEEISLVVANDQASALAAVRDKDFDAILVNTLMRKSDALRLCADLRSGERSRQTPLMAVLDDGDDARLTRAIDIGVTDYLMTPVEPNELIARVRTQIRRRRYMEALRHNYERNMALALSDALTGLYNRRYMEAHLANLSRRTIHSERSLALLMVDIDNFKTVNDTYGHPIGDRVLRAVAERLQNNVRPFDTVARWGGEEFMVVMPETDNKVGCMVGERLRAKVAQAAVKVPTPEGEVSVTISVGVASTPLDGFDPALLIERADEALYRAKEQGRNRVVSTDDEPQAEFRYSP
jgi:two-component system cell cycle response regulator